MIRRKRRSLLMRNLYFPALLALLAGITTGAKPARAQASAAYPLSGQLAPPLLLTQVLEGPPAQKLTLPALRGQVVVVEFWATWCVPCVESIPHLNRLVEQFASQPVRFVSISDENAAQVRKFLADHPIRGWVALDNRQETMHEYHVSFIPLTVIIGPDGTILGRTRPIHLSAENLRAVLAGERPKFPPLEGTASEMAAGTEPSELIPAQPPLFYIDVRPDRNPLGATVVNADRTRITALAWPPKRLLSLVLAIPEDRIFGAQFLPPGRYTIVASAPPGEAMALQRQIEQAFATAWAVRMHRERKKMDVYLLTRLSVANRKPAPAQTVTEGPGPIPQPLSTLVRRLEDKLQRPVLDETGLSASYPIAFPYQGNDLMTLRTALRARGFDLKPSRRKLSVFVVEKR